MKQTHHAKLLILAAGLALGATAAASAQTASADNTSAAPAAPASANYGLLGSDYAGVFYGYEHFVPTPGPTVGREYGAVYNQNVEPGVDLNLTFDDRRADDLGIDTRGDELLAGVTGYAPVNSWLKPFLSARAGVDWTHEADLTSTGAVYAADASRFDYIGSAGAEIQVTPRFVLTPFAAYQEIHRYSHDWNYGVAATYRIVRHWSVSYTPQIDQYHNVISQIGVNYHF